MISKSLISRFNYIRSFKTGIYWSYKPPNMVCNCRKNFLMHSLPKHVHRQYSTQKESGDSLTEYQDEVDAQTDDSQAACQDEIDVQMRNAKAAATAGLEKYKVFEDFDSPVILDVDEERRLRLDHPELFEHEQNQQRLDEFEGMNVERGIDGVFDVEELVDILRKEKALHIVTIRISPEFQYADYMIIASSRSRKHLYTVAEYVRRLFKRKRHESDPIPKIEGTQHKKLQNDWLALDMGNIILHLFLHPTRLKYDLEMLWAVGKDYDDLTHQKENKYISLLQKHTITELEDLAPLQDSSTEEKNELA